MQIQKKEKVKDTRANLKYSEHKLQTKLTQNLEFKHDKYRSSICPSCFKIFNTTDPLHLKQYIDHLCTILVINLFLLISISEL